MVAVVVLALGVTAVIFPDYFRLLRPRRAQAAVSGAVKLVNELPRVDRHNEDIIGRLFAHGGLAHAEEGPDGAMTVDVRAPNGQLIWSPAIIVMPRPGELQVELFNDDPTSTTPPSCPATGTSSSRCVPVGWGGWVKGFAPGAVGVPRESLWW